MRGTLPALSLLFTCFLLSSCSFCQEQPSATKRGEKHQEAAIQPGAWQVQSYLPLLQNRHVAVVANHTSLVANTHLVDTLLSLQVNIVKVFSPEHGFRGNYADGAHVEGQADASTGLPVVSLYGSHRKPTAADLAGVDILLFDLQDVGCRFYTYISTLTYVMEACTDAGIPVVVLDRPNPNGFYIDGPVLEPACASFVGLHPVPVVYGMTIGEYAGMVNGEGWLNAGKPCRLTVIRCEGYTHKSRYRLPVKPSPNLPTMEAVYLYPSLCFFEGTIVSVGRGTDSPFTVAGHPGYVVGSYSFTPHSIPGVSDNPPLSGQTCYGLNLAPAAELMREDGRIELFWLVSMYSVLHNHYTIFTPYFEKLAGTAVLRKQIEQGMSAEAIRDSWKPGLEHFRPIRKKYLLYEDF